MKKDTVYVIGDSHVSIFTGKDEVLPERIWAKNGRFKIYRVGAYTAYNLGNKDLDRFIFENVPRGSKIILSFGEIDCRLHLLKFKNTEQVVERYKTFINLLSDYDVTLMLPPGTSLTEKKVNGTMEERNAITSYFNDLCRRPKTPKVKWIGLFDKTVNLRLETKQDMYFDSCHLKSIYLPVLIKQYERYY